MRSVLLPRAKGYGGMPIELVTGGCEETTPPDFNRGSFAEKIAGEEEEEEERRRAEKRKEHR